MDIKEALNLDGLKYFYTKYIKPLKTGAFATVVNNATTTVANTVLDGRMGKTLADKDANLQNQINTLKSSFTRISEEHFFTTSAEYKYSGISFTIPEGHIGIINIESAWDETKPNGLIISVSHENYDNSNIVYKTETYPPVIDVISPPRTLYAFCRHGENSKKGKIYIRGLLVKVPI